MAVLGGRGPERLRDAAVPVPRCDIQLVSRHLKIALT